MALVFTSLCAEKNVANLVEIPACGSIIRMWRSSDSIRVHRWVFTRDLGLVCVT
jgi:hypothetical protein